MGTYSLEDITVKHDSWRESDRLQAMIDRRKTVKSAFILEARSLKEAGLDNLAHPLYRIAAREELALAELFRTAGRPADAAISLFSAASCLTEAEQYQKALPLLEEVRQRFPDAAALIAECADQPNRPLSENDPQVQALVALLLKKKVISPDEWTEALQTASSE